MDVPSEVVDIENDSTVSFIRAIEIRIKADSKLLEDLLEKFVVDDRIDGTSQVFGTMLSITDKVDDLVVQLHMLFDQTKNYIRVHQGVPPVPVVPVAVERLLAPEDAEEEEEEEEEESGNLYLDLEQELREVDPDFFVDDIVNIDDIDRVVGRLGQKLEEEEEE